jgi:hypothetical protein
VFAHRIDCPWWIEPEAIAIPNHRWTLHSQGKSLLWEVGISGVNARKPTLGRQDCSASEHPTRAGLRGESLVVKPNSGTYRENAVSETRSHSGIYKIGKLPVLALLGRFPENGTRVKGPISRFVDRPGTLGYPPNLKRRNLVCAVTTPAVPGGDRTPFSPSLSVIRSLHGKDLAADLNRNN